MSTNPPLKTWECSINGFLFKLQNLKEHPNRTTNNGDMTEAAKRLMSDMFCDIYVIKREAELQKQLNEKIKGL